MLLISVFAGCSGKTKEEEELEQAKAAAEDLGEAASRAQKEYDDLNSRLKRYDELRDALD